MLDIWLYVAKRNSEASRIVSTQLGRARPEIHAEARSIVIERWLALYRMTEHGVQIVAFSTAGATCPRLNGLPSERLRIAVTLER